MTLQKKHSPGFKRLPGNVFLFFVTACFLGTFLPAGLAANKTEKPPVQRSNPPRRAPLDAGKAYSSVASGKPLRVSTQFKVVDDFNTGELKNSLEGAWTVDEGEDKKAQLDLKKEDARGAKAGGSLWIRYNLKKEEQVTARTELKKLDMSAARNLVLKCQGKTAAPFNGRIRIALRDEAGKTVTRDITNACFEKKGWNDVILPVSDFRGVDFDQLGSLSLSILAHDRNMAGKVGFDEIAFWGYPEVGFESVKDNLKTFPAAVLNETRRKELLETRSDKELLLKIASDTWRYFESAADKKNHLVVDHIKTGGSPLAAAYTSPTNIALELMGAVAARELEIITPEQASRRVSEILRTLEKMKTWRGFFYNFYETTRLGVSRQFVSSVDNGWLAIAMVVIRQAFPGEIARRATVLLKRFHFQEFLDPDNNQLVIGYDLDRESLAPYHYGMLVTEARAMSLCGIGKGDLPKEHWWYLYRTAPEAWEWQTQKPQGKMVEHDKVSYFQGYYKDGKQKFVPSWGGSLFEFLMPTMVIQEVKFAPRGLGMNDKIATELHRDYALREKKYPVWGISPAAIADGRGWQYGEYGIKKLGARGYQDRGVITPHVSFLALETLPRNALQNIRELLKFSIYGEYGFYDSISFPGGKVNLQYLALDQGMVLIPIANYLKNGVIQKYFHQDPIGEKAQELLEKENFFRN